MSFENLSLQKAVNDLSIIKRAIEATGNKDGIPREHSALEAGRVTHLIGAAIGTAIIFYEVFADLSLTQVMLISREDQDIANMGVSFVVMFIPVLLMCLYFITWRESRRAGDDFQSFIGRNFRYLKNLGFVSDVVCKMLPLSVIALLGGVEWIAPILSLYLADFLVGGKYFNFPVRVGLIAGSLCGIIAISQYFLNSSSLFVPLLLFVLLSLGSVAFLLRSKTV